MAEERLGASFSIDTTALKAGLTQANRLIKESESQFKAAAAGMDDWTKSQDGLTAKIKSLNDISELQRAKVEALEKQYQEAGYASDDMSAAAIKLRTDINNQKAALAKTEAEAGKYEQALNDLESGSEDAGDAIEETGEKAEDAGDGFTVAKGAIADLISDGLQSLVGACKDAITSLFALTEETAEYRAGIGKLTTAWEAAGKTAEEANAIYKEFYSVLGDEDRSIESVNHLAKLTDSQEDLAKWTDIAAGVWGTFGDSLPIEGLTEAANETARTGELTGVLTDALNWAAAENETFGVTLKDNIEFTELSAKQLESLTDAQKEEYEARKKQAEEIEAYNQSISEAVSAEDKFKIALADCTSEQERAQLITETLNRFYSEAGKTYEENNKSLIEARKATSDYNDTLADMGAQLEPVNTGITQLKSAFVQELAPGIKKELIPQIKSFFKEIKNTGAVKKLATEVSTLASKGISALSKAAQTAVKAVSFLADNFDTIITVIKAATAAFVAYKTAMAIGSVITALTTAVKGATTAMAALNAVMASNPIGLVAVAISSLIAGLVLLSDKEQEAYEVTEHLSDAQRELIETASETAEANRQAKQATDESVAAQEAQANFVMNNLVPQLEGLFDANGRVKAGEQERVDFILNEFNSAMGTEYDSIYQIVDVNGQLRDSIQKVIEQKQIQIQLAAYESDYQNAIKAVAEQEQARATAAQDLAAVQDDLAEKDQILIDKQNQLEEAMQAGNSTMELYYAGEMGEAQASRDAVAAAVDEKKAKYAELDLAVKESYNTIDSYETASIAAAKNNSEQAQAALTSLRQGYSDTTVDVKNASVEQVEALRQQAIDSGVQLELLKADYEKRQSEMTDAEKVQAEERIAAAQKEADDAKIKFETVGANMVSGMAAGVRNGEGELSAAVREIVRAALEAAEDEADINSPSKVFRKRVGLNIGLGTALGVTDSTKAVVKSVKEQIKAIGGAYELQALSGRLSAAPAKATGTAAAGDTAGTSAGVTIYQTNNYSQAHSRYELYKSKQQTAAAVRLAIQGA